jgi:hypothetical protein
MRPQVANADANEAEIIPQIRQFLQRYGATFVDLATGKRNDLDALLDFYGAPLRFIGPSFHMVMVDRAAITSADGIGGEIDHLRRAGFAASTLDKSHIHVLNSRAVLVEAVWLRRSGTGEVMERFGVLYLITLTTDGWRITSAVTTSG